VTFCQRGFQGSTEDRNFKLCMQISCGGRSMPIDAFLNSYNPQIQEIQACQFHTVSLTITISMVAHVFFCIRTDRKRSNGPIKKPEEHLFIYLV